MKSRKGQSVWLRHYCLSPEHCAKQGPLPSWGLGAVAIGWLVVLLCLQEGELLEEQKGALALALEVCILFVGGNMQICAGGETILFSGDGCLVF